MQKETVNNIIGIAGILGIIALVMYIIFNSKISKFRGVSKVPEKQQ